MAEKCAAPRRKKRLLIPAAALAVLLLIGGLFWLLRPEKPETPLENLFSALQQEDFAGYCACYHPVFAQRMLQNVPEAERAAYMREITGIFRKDYGEAFSFSLLILSQESYTGDTLEILREELAAEGISFSEARCFHYYTLCDDHGIRECKDSCVVIRCGRKWYIAD